MRAYLEQTNEERSAAATGHMKSDVMQKDLTTTTKKSTVKRA